VVSFIWFLFYAFYLIQLSLCKLVDSLEVLLNIAEHPNIFSCLRCTPLGTSEQHRCYMALPNAHACPRFNEHSCRSQWVACAVGVCFTLLEPHVPLFIMILLAWTKWGSSRWLSRSGGSSHQRILTSEDPHIRGSSWIHTEDPRCLYIIVLHPQ
jgi:hypothetical protein